MKKVIPVLLLLALVAVPAVSSANTINVGVEAAFLQPMSDWKEGAGFGWAGSPRPSSTSWTAWG
jgi:hypothetical protein